MDRRTQALAAMRAQSASKMDRAQALRARRTSRDPSLMKGASKLDIMEFHRYDTTAVHDDLAKPSKKMGTINNKQGNGDDDVWVEKLYKSTKCGKIRVFFVSKRTGRKVEGEPPSGASRVLYLKDSYKNRMLLSKGPADFKTDNY